jgi:hypothetical protein
MAIDHIIDYDCEPKRQLTTAGILERIKGRERAAMIIKLFRENGDERPPSEMGFEFTRRTPEGEEETQLVVVQHILDEAEDLKPLEHFCRGCPANRSGTPFGCMSFVQYPITGKAETWLLNQLPSIQEPLVWLLLKQGIESFQYDGKTIEALRQQGDTYFEDSQVAVRFLGDFSLNANQVFEMIFMVGDIIPNHGAILLLFYNAIERSELEATDIMQLAPATPEKIKNFPFLHQIMSADDSATADLKEFFQALWLAWSLNVKLKVDA